MSERTRRPPADSPSETLVRQHRDISSAAPEQATGLTQRASSLDASTLATPQAEAADRMRNSSDLGAQLKTRELMLNSAGTASLRKTAQGMQDSTVQRLGAAQPDTMIEDTMAGANGALPGLQTTAGVAAIEQNLGSSLQLTTDAAPIQRALKVRGDTGKLDVLFKLLGEPAGLKFQRDESETVTIVEELGGEIASPAMRTSLKTIIENTDKAAQVNFSMERDEFLGSFREWQGVDVMALAKIEEHQKGAGAAFAIHEIWENFQAQPAGNEEGKFGRFPPAHEAAMGVESIVATQISKRESVRGADSKDETYHAFDYGTYYLVVHTRNKSAWRPDSVLVGGHALTDYEPGNPAHGDAGKARVAEASAHLAADKLATARVVGVKTTTEADGLGLERAKAVIRELGKNATRSFASAGADAGAGSVTISVTRPKDGFATEEVKARAGDGSATTGADELKTGSGKTPTSTAVVGASPKAPPDGHDAIFFPGDDD